MVIDGEVRDETAGTLPPAITYRLGEEDTPLGGRRLILRIEPAVLFAHEFGLRTRDPETVFPERT